jgi:hypothetical protein
MNHFMLYSPDQTKCVSIACKRMEIKSDHVLNAVNSSRVNEIGYWFCCLYVYRVKMLLGSII